MKKSRIIIRHAIPGRMRFKVCEIRYTYQRALSLEKWLARKSGIIGIEVRANSGSVILLYNHKEISPRQLSDLLMQALEIHPEQAYSRSSRMPSVCFLVPKPRLGNEKNQPPATLGFADAGIGNSS